MTNNAYMGYPDGFCQNCGSYLYNANSTASSSDYCDHCSPSINVMNCFPEKELIPIKKKKSRKSRMEKSAMYGGKK